MMKSLKNWSIIVSFWSIGIITYGQNITIQTGNINLANPDFLSSSTTTFYSILEGNFNTDINQFDTLYFSDELMETIADLDLTNFRFPGGTISQFYHYNGANGYGTIPEDLFCRPNYFNLNGFPEKVKSDSLYPVNFIHSYVDFIKQLEEKQGRSIGTHYALNIMTHFFSGDFIPYNSVIDDLIEENSSSIQNYLDEDIKLIDSTLMEQVVIAMLGAASDPTMGLIVNSLADQNGFLERFTENISALQFLIENGLSIKGVEMGNENYAYLMLQDDDLSEIPYDCTAPDSIVEQYDDVVLPLKTYMQAILKYVLITSMYNDVIKDIWDLETGIVLAGAGFGVKTIELDQFEIIEYSDSKAKFHELWNKFIGLFDFYDAGIPHLYHKGLPDCEIFEAVTKDDLSYFIKNRIDFYFKDVIPWQLDKITTQINHKPLWVTEWNINGAGAFGNTFAHATHTYRFLNELNHYQEKYNITQANYHLTYSLDHDQFSLIRTREQFANGEPVVIKQSMYHAFDYISKTNHQKLQLTQIKPEDWFGSSYDTLLNHHFWAYLNEDQSSLTVNFINQADEALIMPIGSINFNIYNDSNLIQSNQIITNYTTQYFDAESMMSSNKGCSEYPEVFDDYAVIQNEEWQDTIHLPAFSFGKIIFDLSNIKTSVAHHYKTEIKIYPNPCDESFTIQSKDAQTFKSIQIIDVMGKIHWLQTTAKDNLEIAVKDLSNGLYTILFIDDTNKIVGSKKLIINHK
ncbi:MAG: T9SS type A sorting domain-containing protein [Chitinophagales bacterium]